MVSNFRYKITKSDFITLATTRTKDGEVVGDITQSV